MDVAVGTGQQFTSVIRDCTGWCLFADALPVSCALLAALVLLRHRVDRLPRPYRAAAKTIAIVQ